MNEQQVYKSIIRIFALMIVFSIIACSVAPSRVFYNTLDTELEELNSNLKDKTLKEVFRLFPTLVLQNSTPIGNGHMRHQFLYTIVETEDLTKSNLIKLNRNVGDNLYELEKISTFYISFFVDERGMIYEVLKPVLKDRQIVENENKPLDRGW